MEGLPFPEEFRRFFELPDSPQQMPQDPIPQTAGGSGFIVSPDGYILTNDHVVSGATQIRVFLADRREYMAEIVGVDPTTDVAVIKINGQDLPTLSLGSPLDVRVGEWVLAVGNPGFAGSSNPLDHTVTAGIVSATGRPLQLIQRELSRQEEWQEVAGYAIEDFIQTDAVINPGNSGGPLVNVRGQVVGINSAIASRTGYYQGYGFAIPIDLAKRIMQDLVEFGEVRRARLGIEMWPVDPVDAELYGLPEPPGCSFRTYSPGDPPKQAGLRQEDVIVAVDDQEIDRPASSSPRSHRGGPGIR
jgi:serine protease Do